MNYCSAFKSSLLISWSGALSGALYKGSRGLSFKDLSLGGTCAVGFGQSTWMHRNLQVLNDLKNIEKHSQFGWLIASLPIVMDTLHTLVVKEDGSYVRPKELSKRFYTVLKEKKNNLSINQLAFLASAIPLYTLTRTLKNTLWTGQGFDPSGHVMYKVVQQGLLFSLATAHGTKSKGVWINYCFLLVNSLADAAMLANTTANCHTTGEVLTGFGMGLGILGTAHLIGIVCHHPIRSMIKKVQREWSRL
jgi:hypothetical protein